MTAEPVLLQLGPRPEEAVQLVSPGARAAYPDDVHARLSADADEIVSRYPGARSALLPLLHLVQSEDGYITPAGIEFCSARLSLTGAEVAAVATFYSMYRREPTGDYRVGVCTNTLCAIMGGDAVLAAVESHLDLHAGGTTPDGKITLEHIECNAACDYAPVVMVNWEFFDNQTPRSAIELVDDLRGGGPVTPTRGSTLCTFRETERILAGFPDSRAESDSPPGDATLAGFRVAAALEMTAPPIPQAESRTDADHSPPIDGQDAAAEATADKPSPAPSATVPAKAGTAETDPTKTDSTKTDSKKDGGQ